MDERFKFRKIAIDYSKVKDDHLNRYSGTDTEATYLKNLSRFGPNWHYASRPIYYTHNSIGYRSKELEEVDPNNFFITYGCSFTAGMGLYEEESWPEQLSNHLGMDVLNHGIGGSSPEVVHLNSLAFLKNTKLRPKFVAIQWPQTSRLLYKNLNHYYMLGPSFPDATPHTKEFYHFFIKHHSDQYNSYMAFINTQALWELAGIPVFNWAFSNEWDMVKELYTFRHYYPYPAETEPNKMARDAGHFGPGFNARIAKTMSDDIKTNILHLT